MAARSKFIAPGEMVNSTRSILEDAVPKEISDEEIETRIATSAAKLNRMSELDMIEIG